MNAKDFFKLTAKTIDSERTANVCKDDKAKEAFAAYESYIIEEVLRVALLDEEIYQFIYAECPYLASMLKMREMQRQVEARF